MKTDELIERLASGPAHGPAPRLRFVLPLIGGALLAVALLAAALGAPLQALALTGPAPFAMKLGFALSLALASGAALFASARPGARLRGRLAVIAVLFLAVIVLAGMEIFAGRPAWPGATWARCFASIALLSPLTFAGAMLALRRLAPTRLRLSGALAGLLAASVAASAYTLWCPETGAVFLLSWYAAPIALAGIAGAIIGPRMLRW
jgi:hypothetical protein